MIQYKIGLLHMGGGGRGEYIRASVREGINHLLLIKFYDKYYRLLSCQTG